MLKGENLGARFYRHNITPHSLPNEAMLEKSVTQRWLFLIWPIIGAPGWPLMEDAVA